MSAEREAFFKERESRLAFIRVTQVTCNRIVREKGWDDNGKPIPEKLCGNKGLGLKADSSEAEYTEMEICEYCLKKMLGIDITEVE